jgi:NhaP-type Na+/H+ or K+/H+ antiporter
LGLYFRAEKRTSWQDFSRNLITIVSLAVGLVAFTVFGVAEAASWLFSGFDWRIGLPKRITSVLEGESLVNDATGLLALEFGTAIVVYGQDPTFSSGVLRLVYLIAAGITVGLVLGRLVEWFEQHINDAAIEITVSIFVPYAAYLAAQALRGSGVLAVVAAGLYLSRKVHIFSRRTYASKQSLCGSRSLSY